MRHYITSGHLPQSLLFAGAAGSGKTRQAMDFFKSLNCIESPGSPCGRCAVCFKLRSGSHPDLVVFEPPVVGRQVDALREVLDGIRLRPFEARQRLVLIEPAEDLNKSSSNALLKALEEPPPATVFILISHNPALLLPTIVSRCQVLRFAPSAPAGEGAADLAEFRSAVREILAGGDPLALMAKVQPLDREELAGPLSVLDALLRDLWLLSCGAASLVAAELAGLDLRPDYYELDEIWQLLRGLRRGGENQNLKAAFAEIAIRLGRLRAA
ncbi:MAG: DNA polymerase III subunit tau [Deltaproteobacteria bacterium ADurb.Bin510]|nr:MAG: DNA polymerase III subunit tau [Deltaproteobacteria bacterium ADurb.Bin510]